jgi:hypothetical protein
MPTNPDVVPLDRLAEVYIKIRNKIAELTKSYDAEVEALKEQQTMVSNEMKAMLQSLNVRSVNTVGGTVVLTEKTRYFPSDWSEFKRFVKENDAFDLMEKRIAQTNMAKFLEENPDKYPPGLQSETEISVSVRKPTSK